MKGEDGVKYGMTLGQFERGARTVPALTASYLADLGEAKGKQELFKHQSPQILRALRESAIVESAVSSSRIEGVMVRPARVAAVLRGRAALHDRAEEEVRGYRDALRLVHERGARLAVSEATIKRLHQLVRGEVWDAGRYREKAMDIIERYPDGRHRVRFSAVPAAQVASTMGELVEQWDVNRTGQLVHPLVAAAAVNLDFLCIHPFRDGNGRVSRLLLLLQCYHLGLEVGRYVSLERLIERNRNRYYETLESSSQRWHQGRHDPWPYINYILYILKSAYREFEERARSTGPQRGAKTEAVVKVIQDQPGSFRVADVQRLAPAAGPDLIRHVLKHLRAQGRVKCLGRGRSAQWRRTGEWN